MAQEVASRHISPQIQPAAPAGPHVGGSCCGRIFQIIKIIFEWIKTIFTSCGQKAPFLGEYRIDAHERQIIRIKVSNQTLVDNPGYHLTTLANLITERVTTLHVDFVNELTGKIEAGTDEGGLSRQYITSLFKGISLSTNFIKGDNNLSLPCTKAYYQEGSRSVPKLSDEERGMYEAFGKVMKFCYTNNVMSPRNKKLLIGRRFFPCLFEICCKKNQTDLQIIQALIETNDLHKPMLTIVQSKKLPETHKTFYIDYLNQFSYDLPENSSDETVINAIHNFLYARYSRHIEPLRTIGRALDFNNGITLLDAIQGFQDRTTIAKAIRNPTCGNIVVTQKAQWIRDWIQDNHSCTEADIDAFLEFVTGMNTLGDLDYITINVLDRKGPNQKKNYQPLFPQARTCDLALWLNGDFEGEDTKETFITRLKTAIEYGNKDGFQIG